MMRRWMIVLMAAMAMLAWTPAVATAQPPGVEAQRERPERSARQQARTIEKLRRQLQQTRHRLENVDNHLVQLGEQKQRLEKSAAEYEAAIKLLEEQPKLNEILDAPEE
jgi:septal ring factor EnvC (AmiA/AmiB activator)